MIDVRELRIGNWITGLHGPFQVLAVYPFKIAYKVANAFGDYLFHLKEDCTPITITVPMLERCGFKETKWENSVYENEDGEALEYVPEEDGQPAHIRYFTAMSYDYSVKACYLHQLQNVYYTLNQKELEINLHELA